MWAEIVAPIKGPTTGNGSDGGLNDKLTNYSEYSCTMFPISNKYWDIVYWFYQLQLWARHHVC